MSYDSVRQRVVLFGGSSGTSNLADTWEYEPSGRTWTQKMVTGPSARLHPYCAFDPIRRQVVLFGGDPLNSETWTYDGVAWTRRMPTTSPSSRQYGGATWDPTRARVAIYGGTTDQNATPTNGHWEFDGTTWLQRSGVGTGPSGWGQSFALDTLRGRYVAAAGRNASGATSASWELGTSWSQVSPSPALSARYSAATDFDAVVGQVIAVGGYVDGTAANGAYAYDGVAWTTLSSTPTARGSAAMVYDSTRGRLILFGGNSVAASLSDTWEY